MQGSTTPVLTISDPGYQGGFASTFGFSTCAQGKQCYHIHHIHHMHIHITITASHHLMQYTGSLKHKYKHKHWQAHAQALKIHNTHLLIHIHINQTQTHTHTHPDRFLVIGANTAGGATNNDNRGAAYLYELTFNGALSTTASLIDNIGVFGSYADNACFASASCGASFLGTTCAMLLDSDLSTIAVSSPALVSQKAITVKAQVDLFLTDSSTPSLAYPTTRHTITSPLTQDTGAFGDNFGWSLAVAKISGKFK